jgi:hypothetical protein
MYALLCGGRAGTMCSFPRQSAPCSATSLSSTTCWRSTSPKSATVVHQVHSFWLRMQRSRRRCRMPGANVPERVRALATANAVSTSASHLTNRGAWQSTIPSGARRLEPCQRRTWALGITLGIIPRRGLSGQGAPGPCRRSVAQWDPFGCRAQCPVFVGFVCSARPLHPMGLFLFNAVVCLQRLKL